MPTSDMHEALRHEASQAEQAADALTARLTAAKAEKTSQALQLNAAQEEYRRAGLFRPRRGALKAEIARQTAAYTAITREIEDLTACLAQARALASQTRQALADYERDHPAMPATSAVPATAPAPTARPRKKAAQRSAAPESLEEQAAHLLRRLEQYYPEHQVFALDSISSDLRTRLLQLAKHSGYAGIADLLTSQGWQCIRGEAVLALRRGKYCTPGEEPSVIRPQVESMLRRLKACYPDQVIPRSIQRDHKSLSQDITGLYQWLGYGSAAEMLSAYGYRYLASGGGRPATDAAALLIALREAYPNAKPASVQQIMQEHPEYAAALKTLQNRAPSLYDGMSLGQKLQQEGILPG